jgi:hypothetical protein
MGAGTSSQQQSQTQQSQTQPWDKAIPQLTNILGQIGQQPLGPTSGQQGAASNLVSGANAIPQMGPSVTSAISNYLNPNFLNPNSNPFLGPAIQGLNQQIGSGIAGQFAGAGRDPSGNAQASEAIARGESQADMPLLLNQFNTNAGLQQGAIGQLPSIAQSYLTPGTAQLGAATQQAQLPLANTLAAEQATIPIAGLGSQTQGSGQAQGSYTMSPIQQMAMLFGGGGTSPFSAATNAGGGILGSLAKFGGMDFIGA